MAWYLVVWHWLAHAAVGSLLILAMGGLAVRLCRQPVQRLRVIELALVACLIVPWLSLLPDLPHWSAGVLSAPETADELPIAPSPSSEPVAVTAAAPALPSVPPTEVAAGAQPLDSGAGLPGSDGEPPGAATAAPPVVPQRAALLPALPTPFVIVLAYLVAVALLGCWWLFGVAKLLYLHWTARPAPQPIVDLFRQLAGPSADRVRLLVNHRIALPLTFRWWRSAILLPADQDGSDSEALRYCLAHEWSHIERRDLWTWHLAMVAQFLFFYQPLFWWLRRQLRLCQDYLADARAAEQAPMAEDYAEYLVGLAQRRLGAPAMAALGIGDRRSNLYRRITMLINPREPLQRRCRRWWSLSVGLAAVSMLAVVAAVRLDAGDSPAKDKPEAKKETPKEQAQPPNKAETLNYTGKVTDKDTGKGIQGATVTVRRSLLGDPRSPGHNKVLQETKHQTDANGKYNFTIPAEQSGERYLYIELDVEHPDYAPKAGFGYALSMILKNQKLGGRPFFENTELRPGKAVTGRIETPDGKPAEGVELLAYSVTDKKGDGFFEYGSFARAKSDKEGRFRIVLVTPGRAVFWILPEKYSPSLHVVKNNKRGDLGVFGLQKGITVKGKVVDVKGKPVPGIYVNIERSGPRDEELQALIVADSIRRGAVTNDKGEFEMAPLGAGEYDIHPDEHNYDPNKKERTSRPLPAVFIRQKLTLKEGETPDAVEVRAVPTVTIEAQYIDSKGKPTRGHECFVFGQIDNTSWFGQGRPDADGKIVALVPHGLKNVQLDLMTNEHGVLRHRMNAASPLKNQRRVDLGTLTEDVKGIQIIRYVAPIVLVKVVAKDGSKLKDVVVTGLYPEGKAQYQGGLIGKKGIRSDVHWEEQEDGRFRSSQLFPDEEVTITAMAEGYQEKKEKVKLAEGATKDLTITLEKK